MDCASHSELHQSVFALGCLWGADPVFGGLDGVVRTCVGFAGGRVSSPTHADIGDHIEAVRVTFAPSRIAYGDLLARFWSAHTPTQTPAKRRYRSALFPCTARQAEQARAQRPSSVEGVPLLRNAAFHAAAPSHQNYKLRRHDALMEAFRARLPSETAFVRSPAATLANAYVAGHRAPERLAEDRERLGLPSEAIRTLHRCARRHQGWAAFVDTTETSPFQS